MNFHSSYFLVKSIFTPDFETVIRKNKCFWQKLSSPKNIFTFGLSLVKINGVISLKYRGKKDEK